MAGRSKTPTPPQPWLACLAKRCCPARCMMPAAISLSIEQVDEHMLIVELSVIKSKTITIHNSFLGHGKLPWLRQVMPPVLFLDHSVSVILSQHPFPPFHTIPPPSPLPLAPCLRAE